MKIKLNQDFLNSRAFSEWLLAFMFILFCVGILIWCYCAFYYTKTTLSLTFIFFILKFLYHLLKIEK